MTIADEGVSPVCVVWSGRNAANAQVVGWSRCEAAPPPADTDGDAVADTTDCAFADSTAWTQPALVSGLRLDRSGEIDAIVSWTDQSASAGPSTISHEAETATYC